MTAARTALLAALLLLIAAALDTTPAETEPSVTPIVRVVPASRGDRPDVLTTRATMPTATAVPTATVGPKVRALGVWKVTAYCDQGITRSGEPVRHGVVAVDPLLVSLRSVLWIEGFASPHTALDTGGGVKGEWLDIWMPSCEAAVQWGVRYKNVVLVR